MADDWKCDLCGQSAAFKERDAIEVPSQTEWKEFEFGEIRTRCDEHREPSVTKYLDG